MPKGRPTPKPVRAPKAAPAPRVAAPKPAPKPALRAPNMRASNPIIAKAVKARKK